RTGRGQLVEVAMQEAVLNLTRVKYTQTLATGKPLERTGNRSATGGWSDLLRCAGNGSNDYVYMIIPPDNPEMFEAMTEVIARPFLGDRLPRAPLGFTRRRQACAAEGRAHGGCVAQPRRLHARGDPAIARKQSHLIQPVIPAKAGIQGGRVLPLAPGPPLSRGRRQDWEEPKLSEHGSMNGAEWLARALAEAGTTHVFFVESVLRRTLLQLKDLGVTPILAHSEKAAAYMADGYARIVGRPGVWLAQAVGAANLASGLQDPFLGRAPVVALTGRKPPSFQHRNAYQE